MLGADFPGGAAPRRAGWPLAGFALCHVRADIRQEGRRALAAPPMSEREILPSTLSKGGPHRGSTTQV